MPDINNIQTKELGSEQAVVDIMFKGTAERLAEELVTKTFDSFDIEIFDVKEGALTIRFLPQNGDQPVNEKEMESVFISE